MNLNNQPRPSHQHCEEIRKETFKTTIKVGLKVSFLIPLYFIWV